MPKKTVAKKTTFGADLIEGMKLVLVHQRGKVELEQVWPKPIDVKAIRKRVKMSQAEFSRTYGISKRALQEWEQGGRQPDSAARAYLTVIAKEPAVVRRALAHTADVKSIVNEIMRIEDAIKRVHSSPDSWVRVEYIRTIPTGLELWIGVHEGRRGRKTEGWRIICLGVREFQIADV